MRDAANNFFDGVAPIILRDTFRIRPEAGM